MTEWDIVECGFNTADETINFGGRNFGDGDNLYETCTLVSVKNSEPHSHSLVNLHLHSCIRNGKVFYSINRNIKAFSDLSCKEIYFSMTFEEVIDIFFVTIDCHYLIVCLRDGTLHCIDLLKLDIIFSELVDENDQLEDECFIGCFMQEYMSISMNFLLVLRCGKVYSINFSEENQNDETKYSVIKSMIFDYKHFIKCASFYFPFLFMNGDIMVMCNIVSGDSVVQDGLNLKKVFPYSNDMFIALDTEGNLLQICNKTSMIFYIDVPDNFDNFIYIINTGQPLALCVTKPDEIGISNIKCYNTYPVFSEDKFSLKLPGKVHLVYPENIHDESMFVYLFERNDTIEELRFQVICETVPEHRFKTLLRRHKFQEAEKFAKLFNLDENEIKMSKAQIIMDKQVCSSEHIRTLIEILDGINNHHFKLQCCFNVYNSCENWDDVAKILNYGSNVPVNSDNEYLPVITDMMYRFDTFMLIQRLGSDENNWTEFSSCDLINLLCSYLKKGYIEEAIIIYNRLDLPTAMRLGEDTIEMILDLLDNLSLNVTKPFLYSFIPITLSLLPMVLPIFVTWLTQEIFYIEQTCYDKFPEYAIEFTYDIIKLMKVDSVINVNFQQQCILNKNSVDSLQALVKALKTVRVLKDEYQIYVPLKEYEKGARSLIRTFLLLDLNEQIYDEFIKHFLCEFMLENKFQPDEIFLEEIEHLVQYEERYWVTVIPLILKYINSVEVKLKAVILLLEATDEPWSMTVHQIARSVLEYKHDLVESIQDKLKNEPINVILRKPVYKLHNEKLDISCDLLFIIRRIIYCNKPTMVQDIYQLCEGDEQKDLANVMLFRHFVEKGEFERAIEILDHNTPEAIIRNCENIIEIISLKYGKHKNYGMILKSLFNRWNENNEKCGQQKLHTKETIENLINYYKIEDNLHINIEIEDFKNSRKKTFLLDSLLENAVQDLCDNKLNPCDTLEICKKISGCLNEPFENVAMKFAVKTSNINITYMIGEYVYANDDSSKNLCLMATLLLRNINPKNIHDSDNITDYPSALQTVDVNIYTLSLKLAWKLVTKSILKSVDDINLCVEVSNWMYSLFYISNHGDLSLNRSIFKNYYTSEIIFPTIGTFRSIKSILNMYTQFMFDHSNPNLRYLTHFELQVNQLTKEQFIHKLKQVPLIIQNLCIEGHNLTAFKLIITLQKGLVYIKDFDIDLHKILNNILTKQCVAQLLHKVLATRLVDTELAFNLLLSLKLKDVLQLISYNLKMYKKDVMKTKTIAQLALRLIRYHNMETNKELYSSIVLRAKWWKKIDNCQIVMKNFFTFSSADLIENLLSHQHLTLNMLKEFCLDFDLNLSAYYHVYLRRMLLNWKPEYKLNDNAYEQTKIHFENNEDLLYEKCMQVVELIEDKSTLQNFVNGIYNTVNFYHYEVFICIFKMLSMFKNKDYKKNLMLLAYLKSYTRVKKPSDAEVEEWYSAFPDSQNIDPLSQWRIPFTLTLFSDKISNIIRPEINLQTYTRWIEVIPILQTLNVNEICSYVIKEIVSSGVLQKNVNSNWMLHPVHESLFKEIDVCLQNMTDLEIATSAIYHLMTHTPKGADQVNAAKLCLKYALEYKKTSNTPAMSQAFTKVQKKFLSFSACHILHIYKLGDEKYTEMSLQSDELISALYMDDRILKRADAVVLNCPDINKAVDKLANLYGINIQEKRHKLLNGWLMDSDTSNFDLDMTVQSTFIKTDNKGSSLEDSNLNNLKRAAYICQNDNILYWQKYLLKIGIDGDSQNSNGKCSSFKANALKCFVMISDISTIEALTCISYNCFMDYIDKLFLVSDLESLGFSIDVERLNEYDKKDLLRRLAQDINNPTTVRIMGSLCITYIIYDIKFWEIIINTSVKRNLYIDLKKYVNFLKNETGFKYKKCYINAWQSIINNLFNIYNETDEQLYDLCVKNMLMIQSCPVLFSLNFKAVFYKCCQLRKYEFAAIVTQYMTVEDRTKCIKELELPHDDIISKIDKLFPLGICGSKLVKTFLQKTEG